MTIVPECETIPAFDLYDAVYCLVLNVFWTIFVECRLIKFFRLYLVIRRGIGGVTVV